MSIRLDSIESTRIVCPCVDWLYRKSICAAVHGRLKILSIRSNRHESFALVAIRYTGSRLARDLEIIIALYCAGCLKTLRFVSIRLNRQESVSLLVSSSHFAGCRFARSFPLLSIIIAEVDLPEMAHLKNT